MPQFKERVDETCEQALNLNVGSSVQLQHHLEENTDRISSPVPLLSTFYTVQATLVRGSTSTIPLNDEAPEITPPVYNTVLVPRSPWWNGRAGLILISLSLIITGVLLGLFMPSSATMEPMKSLYNGTIHPNHSNSCAEFKQALFATDCVNCQPNVAIDNGTVVVVRLMLICTQRKRYD